MDKDDTNHIILVVCVLASAVMVVIFLPLILVDMDKEERRKQMEIELKEMQERQEDWNDRFLTLDDCTEMILQLTEKRFYDDTYKQEAWDHYRGLC